MADCAKGVGNIAGERADISAFGDMGGEGDRIQARPLRLRAFARAILFCFARRRERRKGR